MQQSHPNVKYDYFNVSSVDNSAPTAPSNLSATVAGGSQINLAWSASTDNVGVTGYRVERCQGSGCTAFAEIATSTAVSYSDTGLSAGTTYSYRVRAIDAAGNLSAYSNTASATTSGSSTVLFSDDFNRTTGLGSNWNIYYGTFNTDGAYAVSAGAAGTGEWAGITPAWTATDYSVESTLIVPAASHYSGIIVRGNAADISTGGYIAQIDTAGTVNLYRRSAGGVWTLLQSYTVTAGIQSVTPYTVKLSVAGSNPVNLTVYFQGSSVITYSDTASNLITSGIPGLQNYDPNVKYDYFTVTTP